MAKFIPQPGKRSPSNFKLGEATVKQLDEAIAAGDYAKLAMALGRDQSHLSEDTRTAIKTAHETFLSTVRNFIVEGSPCPETWSAKKVVTLKETERALRDLNEVTSELTKIAAHEIIPQSKLIALQTLISRSQRAVHTAVLKHADSIRKEFVDKIGDLTIRTNDALDVEIESRDHNLLQNLSLQIIEIYNLSCLIEDTVEGWHLGKKNRQPLRIIAKRLTNEANIPTDLAIRPVTNPS
jgi:hypothetical protein